MMKYLVGVTIAFVLFIIVATRQENTSYQFACGVPFARVNKFHSDTTAELVFNPPYKWKKVKLQVYFIDVFNYDLIKKTLQVANEWGKHCSIKFEVTTDIWNSDIRVAFRAPMGYLSAIGNSASHESYVGKATLWLENLDMRSEDEFRRVVLHEFGHAIGLEHELQSPNVKIEWDTCEVYLYFDTAYHWSKGKVDSNVFSKINTGQYTKADYSSIMIYAVPWFLKKDKKGIGWPNNLSSTDKETIKKHYP